MDVVTSIDLVQNDTLRSLRVTLGDLQNDGVTPKVVDLTGAASILAIADQDGVNLFSRTVTGDSSGVIDMAWQTGDLAKLSDIYVQYQVTWSAGKIQTFPVRPLRVRIHPELV